MIDQTFFTKQLIKGRATETVFEMMVREQGGFVVVPFGYEHTAPMLAQLPFHKDVVEIRNNTSDTPDFLLFSNDQTRVLLVEVRYRSVLSADELRKMVEALERRQWESAYLFIATNERFYWGKCSDVRDEHEIGLMDFSFIPVERQMKYHALLMEFLAPASK